jgi:hypothetical protein
MIFECTHVIDTQVWIWYRKEALHMKILLKYFLCTCVIECCVKVAMIS